MKRLKNMSGLFLAVLIGLCVISTPVLAEYPWVGDPPGRDDGDGDPIGPRGGPSNESIGGDRPIRAVTFTGALTEISYYLVELWIGDDKNSVATQVSSAGTKDAPRKVK